MRRILLLFSVLGFCLTMAAQTERDVRSMIPDKIDQWNIQQQFDRSLLEQLARDNAHARKVAQPTSRKAMRRADGVTVDTVSYFGVAQSFYKSYTFTYEGGDIVTYNVGVAIDGTKVTFTKLFNLFDPTVTWTVNEDYPVSGTYDPAAKTITIPTSTVFANATIAGSMHNGYYMCVLQSGTVNEDGKLSPADNLVFNVDGDFDRIWTNQHFGISQYTADGSHSYGFSKVYRSFSMNLPKAEANLLKFNDIIEYGEDFPNNPVTKSITVVNTGSDATDYVITVEADDDAFTTTTESGTIEGLSTAELSFTFNAANIGEYEGLATVEYEGGEPLLIQMGGTIKPYPDFSQVVKNGDFDFTTNIEFPFELTTLADGTTVARSTTNGSYGSSKLTATFTVPDGKLGLLSWKGESNNNHYWYYAAGGIFVDDLNTAAYVWQGAAEDISKTIELAPGEHTVRFQFDQSYYSGDPEEGLYVYDIDLQTEDLDADKAILVTEELNIGNFILESTSTVAGDGTIKLQNKGANDLRVTAVTSDNDEFAATVPTNGVATLAEIEVPVTFSASTVGEKSATLTIETTAGTFTAVAKANVIAMPDYSQIVNEGAEYLTFTANAEHPFIVEDGKAYNLNSGVTDTEYSLSSFKVSFTIPEGKLGYLSWDGHSWGTPTTEETYWAGGAIDIKHPMNSGLKWVYGDNDAGSYAVFASDELWADFLACVPGDHSIEFQYVKSGDGKIWGDDRMEISNFKLHIIDYQEHNAELLTNTVEFDSVYVGPQRYSTAIVQLKNIGSQDLEVTEITSDGAFYGIVPTDVARFNQTLDVTLWFYPSEEGETNGTVTIKTNAGDFYVDCHGRTKNSDGLLLIGDFEDAAYGWSIADGNNDGETWDLGTNLWGDVPTYVLSGNECLASISYSNYLGSITPDNWTFSPAVTIPDNGATLTFYVAAFHPERYAEHYSLYITEDISTLDGIKATEPVIEATINTPALYDDEGNVAGWEFNSVDLAPYAGKTVYLAFRHHGCTGQYILRLDDVFIRTNTGGTTAIDGITSGDAACGRTEIFDISGVKKSELQRGVNIVRTYSDSGTVKSSKIIKR